MKKNFLLFLCAHAVNCSIAQLGGTTVYNFLNTHPNARVAALGGSPIAVPENDINLSLVNPSLLNKEMSDQVTYNYVAFPAGIGAGYAAYAHSFDSVGTFATGIQYIRYGDIEETDARGDRTGRTISSGEYNIHLSYARNYGKFSVGGAVKFISSTFDIYSSYGLAADLAGTYYDRKNLFTVAGVISNYGRQLTTYREGNREELPLNVSLGLTKGFRHNPLRFGITLNHLEKPGKLLYQNPNRPGAKKDLETGEAIEEDLGIFKKTMSHITLSAELVLGKNFYAGLGYNYLRQWEMQMDNLSGFAGFTWGFGIKVNKFQVGYAYSGSSVAYGSNHFSLVVFMGEFFRRKTPSAG